MSNQQKLDFELREIDRDATKARVESRLESCRLFMQLGYHPEIEAKVTPGYSMSPSSQTNAFHSSTESTAQQNVDEEERRRQLVESTLRAIGRLTKQEAEIIKRRYLDEDDALDYLIYSDMNVSQRKYYRIKSRAFYKLALVLRMEVYVDQAV